MKKLAEEKKSKNVKVYVVRPQGRGFGVTYCIDPIEFKPDVGQYVVFEYPNNRDAKEYILSQVIGIIDTTSDNIHIVTSCTAQSLRPLVEVWDAENIVENFETKMREVDLDDLIGEDEDDDYLDF